MRRTFRFFLLFLAILFLPLAGGNNATAQSWRWVLLGQRRINFSLGSDVIEFGARESRYAVLQLRVVDGTMNLYDLEIEYRDGYREEVQVTHSFRPGNDVVIIPVPEQIRIIKSITFYYDTDNYSRNKATLLVLGSH